MGLQNIWYWIENLFLLAFGLQASYFFVFSMASVFPMRRTTSRATGKQRKFAVMIPGYKEDAIIIDTAEKALNQDYPADKYRVLILADSFSPETLRALRKLDVEVLEVSFENSTKAKSLNKGLEYLESDPPDAVVILDSDNVMAPDFLSLMNARMEAGAEVIQGHRTAKNQDTAIALLDAINEEIGNSIFRRGHRNLGFSSSLIGSAMAFPYRYFKGVMADIRDVSGEDKLIEFKVLGDCKTIYYLEDALVYDEKVSNGQNFSKQRTRWVGVQLYFFKHYIFRGFAALFRGKLDYFEKALQMGLIPKVLLIASFVLFSVLALLGWLSPVWLIFTVLYLIALLIAVPRRFFNKELIRAILHIPMALYFMILGILRIRRTTASKFEVTEKKVR